jgi:hypothetical protein
MAERALTREMVAAEPKTLKGKPVRKTKTPRKKGKTLKLNAPLGTPTMRKTTGRVATCHQSNKN